MQKIGRSHVVGALATVAGLVAGAVFGAPIISSAIGDTSVDGAKFRDFSPEEAVLQPPYPVNDLGMSYGSGLNIDAKNPGPDLVAAYGIDGTPGYVRAVDRPAIATDLVDTSKREPVQNYTIPLYAQDGRTEIGRFPIGPGTSYSANSK